MSWLPIVPLHCFPTTVTHYKIVLPSMMDMKDRSARVAIWVSMASTGGAEVVGIEVDVATETSKPGRPEYERSIMFSHSTFDDAKCSY